MAAPGPGQGRDAAVPGPRGGGDDRHHPVRADALVPAARALRRTLPTALSARYQQGGEPLISIVIFMFYVNVKIVKQKFCR